MKIDKEGLLSELDFKTSRSGGKGGQNVNKTSTRVELYFNIDSSAHLTDEQKELITKRLKNKINSENILRIYCDQDRSQGMNKKKAIEKFLHLVAGSLRVEKKRVATKVPSKVKEERIRQKKIISQLKQLRKNL